MDGKLLLGPHVQRRTSRNEQPCCRTVLGDKRNKGRNPRVPVRRLKQPKHASIAQVLQKRSGRVARRRDPNVHQHGEFRDHSIDLVDRREIEVEDTIRELRYQGSSYLDSQATLSDSTSASNGHEWAVSDQSLKCGNFGFSVDEGRCLSRQIRRMSLKRSEPP